jgi:redox-sensitive bicupin YhaK (pirin superfamily)
MNRRLVQTIKAIATRDGGGVVIHRSLGQSHGLRLDPFLLLDEFSSDKPDDYLAGFPAHPHRGFETVTYMLDGHMLHEDHLGNRGELRSGDVQWMTAGRGIVHSEMPQQDSGRMHGFQLWLNLPAADKMQAPAYRDIPAAQIPVAQLPGGGRVKLIAGAATLGERTVAAPINAHGRMSTDPLYFDVELPAQGRFVQPLPPQHHAFVYLFEGALDLVAGAESRALDRHSAAILSPGERLEVQAGEQGARFLLLAGRPLREPVVQYGPFVMNTREEIEQALRDYQSGALAASV